MTVRSVWQRRCGIGRRRWPGYVDDWHRAVSLRGAAWIEDPHFDPATVVHHWALPARSDVRNWPYVRPCYCPPHLRDRPLWELHVLGPLADGGGALGAKIHPALGDGLRAVELGLLFDDLARCGAHARVW